jgi:signal transduction histidine kinase
VSTDLDLQEFAGELLDAVVSIGADPDLHSVLERMVLAACRLSGARYGAIGVIGEDRKLVEFVTHGLTPEEIERIGPLPEGHGVLGVLIDNPEPIRLLRLPEHPQSYGVPPGHPPMTTFLGVPVRIRDRVFGNLYLTDKEGGFTERDERVVVALATAAAFVVENARLYALSERRRQWLEASTRISESLRGGVALNRALTVVAAAAREASGAAMTAVLVEPRPGAQAELTAVDGATPERVQVMLDHVSADVAKVLASGDVAVVDEHSSSTRRVVIVPLRPGAEDRGGVLVAAMPPTGSIIGGSGEETQLLASFADQASRAVERAQAQADRDMLALLADRDRIARDLHDLVIQRLFATGLQLQGASRLAVRPEVRQRISDAVTELDATIRDIRASIFELHHRPGESSLRADVHDLVRGYAGVLGFTPAVQISGPIDTAVTAEAELQLLAVLREGLSNVARHAHATSVVVEIRVSARDVTALVRDDGVGVGVAARESGLANMRARAEALGGVVRLGDARPRGTVLEWSVPL